MNPVVDPAALPTQSTHESANVSYENVQFMTVENLKDYLRARCLPISGSRDVLVSRVFTAMEMKIPVEVTGVDYLRVQKEQYKNILERVDLQDPFSEEILKKPWLNEKDGMSSWPDFTFVQLTKWLTDSDRLSKHHMDKGHQFFNSGWCKEIHCLKQGDGKLVLKNKCTRSQAISSLPHECWVVMESPSAVVHAAYCSCVAG